MVEMRESNKCGSVMNDEIFNLHLGSGAGPWVRIPCLLQDTSDIYWFHSPTQLTTKKQRTKKWDSTLKKLYGTGLGLRTQNPGIREVDLEPSAMVGSDKDNMLNWGRKTAEKNIS